MSRFSICGKRRNGTYRQRHADQRTEKSADKGSRSFHKHTLLYTVEIVRQLICGNPPKSRLCEASVQYINRPKRTGEHVMSLNGKISRRRFVADLIP